MSDNKNNNLPVKIGAALIILAAAGIMLPAIFAYVAGIGRMVILIVVALAAAYFLNLLMARQAVNRMRKARAGANDGGDSNGENNSHAKSGSNDESNGSDGGAQ
ncbi:MAG: hypothetical protein IT343_05845 [Candidatus Melainabacteria bacterium]|nr:hypothetical protein [Candidatus Melainabacteria bacterium]